MGLGGGRVRGGGGGRLSVLASRNSDPAAELFVGVAEITKEHWAKYGRNYYMRYDYEDVDGEKAKQVRAPAKS
jgi:phosphoglucomutase